MLETIGQCKTVTEYLRARICDRAVSTVYLREERGPWTITKTRLGELWGGKGIFQEGKTYGGSEYKVGQDIVRPAHIGWC